MFKNAKIISFFVIISRIFGYLRDFFIATYFGTSVYTDIFFIVFRMPNSLRRFLGEGAINSSVVPVLSKTDDKEKAKTIWNIIFVFALILIVISILGIIFSKFLIALFAAGFLHSPQFAVINTMTKIIFPYIFFIGLSVLLMGILNTYNHFAIPAFAPTLLNISIISSIIFLYSKFTNPIYALCVGVIAGGILQLAISFIDFFKLGIPIILSFKLEKNTKEILKLMSVTAIGSGIFQIASMVDAFMASFMPHGSFSYLFYANRLFQLPFAVFAVALTQSSIVDLSRVDKKDMLKKSENLIRFVSLISIPTTLFFIFFGKSIITLLFKHGKFNEISLNNTYTALVFMILGFFFFSQSKILSNMFYAIKDAKTPLKASTVGAVFSIIFSVILGLLYGFRGLALAMSISGVANMIVLVFYIDKTFGKVQFKNFFNVDTAYFFFILLFISFIIKKFHTLDFVYVSISLVSYSAFSYFFYKRLHLE